MDLSICTPLEKSLRACCGHLWTIDFCSTYDRSSFVRGVQKNPPRFPILSFCLKRCRWCRGLLAGCLFAERLWFLCFCEHDAGFECAVLCTGLFLGCLRVACKLLMVSTFAKQLRVMTKCIHAVRQLVCDVAQVIGSCPQ